MTQRAERWSTGQQSSCPCYTEVKPVSRVTLNFVAPSDARLSPHLVPPQLVQTVVIVFHRQWLDLRGSLEPTDSTGQF